MKLTVTILGIALALNLTTTAGDLAARLDAFSAYRFGDAKESLHAARLAAFRNANDDGIRQENERLLIAFIQSDASVDARREACLWLANLGTTASVPALEALSADERFADVAAIALAEVKGKTITIPLRETATASPAAMLDPDERTARMAMESIVTGADTAAARAWVVAHHSELPPHRQIAAMHTLLRAGAVEGAEFASQLTTSGHPGVRHAAITALGTFGREKDLPRFAEWLQSGDEATQAAAKAALVAAPETAVRDMLVEWLRAENTHMQAMAIDIAADRGAQFAADELLRIANDPGNPNQKPAIAAIAWASPAEAFPLVLDRWISAAGGPLASDWQSATWALARRQADYPAAIQSLHARAVDAPQAIRSAIQSMAGRLESTLPELPLDGLRATP